MTSPAEREATIKSEEADRQFLREICRGLSLALGRYQHELLGFSVKITPDYYLLSIRTYHDGEYWVSFVGAAGIRQLFIKAAREARQRRMSHRVDTFACSEV